jgi:hypothetical protein
MVRITAKQYIMRHFKTILAAAILAVAGLAARAQSRPVAISPK